jgi:microcystin-dependent protein
MPTPTLQLPYPVSADTADVPRDVKALADSIDGLSILGPGEIKMWPVAAPPGGWASCNGQTVDANLNPKLAALLGQAAGVVTLPDFTDRFPAGAGATNGAIGAKAGEATHALSTAELAAHTHPVAVTDPGHTHPTDANGSHNHQGATNADGANHYHAAAPGFNFVMTTGSSGNQAVQSGGGAAVMAGQLGSTTASGANTNTANAVHTHGINPDGNHTHTAQSRTTGVTAATTPTGAGTAHENRPPFIALNFIIKLG